jgi:cytochrome c oxidase cbb3-type subunit III
LNFQIYPYTDGTVVKLLKQYSFFLLLALPLASHALNGEKLYHENCAICHGNEGNGGVGIPLALPAFLEQASDEYLIRTILFGRPGRIMPAFTHLSHQQAKAIAHFVRQWHPDNAPKWDSTAVTGNKEAGALLFDEHCASCHGKDAKGSTGTGVMFSRPKDLPISAPALNNPGFLNSASDAMIKNIVIKGRPGTPMQAAKQHGLTDSHVNDIVSYIRSLQRPPQSTANTPVDEPAALVYDSSYSFEETVNNVKNAAIGMNFKLIREQALDDGLVPKGKESKKQTMVYFCNFKFLYDALTIDPRVGMFLPCRITVVENKGKVQVMSINPKRLSRLFNNNELDNACSEMHELYTSILEEATL